MRVLAGVTSRATQALIRPASGFASHIDDMPAAEQPVSDLSVSDVHRLRWRGERVSAIRRPVPVMD